jgi:alpha-amylase
MGVCLIGWGRFLDAKEGRVTVGAPNSTPPAPWLWDLLASWAPRLRDVGFTALQLPPASKAQGGSGAGCDGYGVFDLRDLGSKPQQGSTPTRYGTVESLRRLIGSAHAVGIDVYLDVVLHQLSGENGGPGVFRYLGADQKTLNGRGPMQSACFRGVPPANRPDDDVPAPSDDFEFGREKVYQNCQPAGYTTRDAIDFGDWLFRTTDADGMRFDDTKGTWASFVSEFMRSRAMASKFAYSEFFDGNPDFLNGWATQPPLSSRSLVEDFTLHWAIQGACNNGNAALLDRAGFIARNPFMACTFVDNPDTDTSDGEAVVSAKLLGYAFLLTAEGYPLVYGKDYFGGDVWPGAYGLKPWIDNLVWIHETLAAGSTVTRYVDNSVIVLNRTGGPGLLTGLNFDTYNRRQITCETSFGAHTWLHDYTGHHPDIWTDDEGRATFTLPPNAYQNGQSYLCFSRGGIGGAIQVHGRSTTQVFVGADDLDIPALRNPSRLVGRIWCREGTQITVTFRVAPGEQATPPHSEVEGRILNAAGAVLATRTWAAPAASGPALEARAAQGGWHSLWLSGTGLAADGTAFELSATYTGKTDQIL